MVIGYGEAIRSLWVGSATVTVYAETVSASTGRMAQSEQTLYENIPCRVSHKAISSTFPQDGAGMITQSEVLYIAPTYTIPEGSKISVTQNGVTKTYVKAGNAAFYTEHQEIPIELYKDRA